MKNQTHFRIFAFFALLIFGFWSCDNSGSGSGHDSDSTGTSVDSLAEVPPPPPPPGFDCADLDEGKFCSLGLNFIQLGDTLMWRELNVEAKSMKDTVYVADVNGDTLACNVRMIRFEDGGINLESDWEEAMYLNRIVIETPSYQSTRGLHVGSTMGELRAEYPELQARGFQEFGVDEVVAPENPYLIFQVADANGDYVNPMDSTFSADGIPDEAKVVRIVVM